MKEVKEEKKIETTKYSTFYESWDGIRYINLKDCLEYELDNRFNKKELTNYIFYTVNSAEELIDFIKDYSSVNQWHINNYAAFCNTNINEVGLVDSYDMNRNYDEAINEINNEVKFPLTFCVNDYVDECDSNDNLYLLSIDKALSKSVDELEYAQMNFREINEFIQEINGKEK